MAGQHPQTRLRNCDRLLLLETMRPLQQPFPEDDFTRPASPESDLDSHFFPPQKPSRKQAKAAEQTRLKKRKLPKHEEDDELLALALRDEDIDEDFVSDQFTAPRPAPSAIAQTPKRRMEFKRVKITQACPSSEGSGNDDEGTKDARELEAKVRNSVLTLFSPDGRRLQEARPNMRCSPVSVPRGL